MGLESATEATFKGKTATGKARLETVALEFRGNGLALSIPFAQMKRVVARDGVLMIASTEGTLALELGPAAEKWAARIRNPPSRLDKIGVKAGWRVSMVGERDADFVRELRKAAGVVAVGRVAENSDAIFLGARTDDDLHRLAGLASALQPAGALWVIRPKGRPEISEASVMAAGKAAGLVDVKVVAFSSTHTAAKFVIPLKDRGRRREEM